MNWRVSSFIVTSVIIASSQTTFASEAKCPITFKPFTEQECTDPTKKALYEAVKKKLEKANKCHKEGEGEVKGAKDIDDDNKANHKTVTEETTKNLKNCSQCRADVEANINKDCSQYPTNRQDIQEVLEDTRQKNERTQALQQQHLTHSQTANKERKIAGYTEETRADNRAHEREEQARIMADTNTITEVGVGNVTTLKREGERVDSSVMTAFKLWQWIRKSWAVFG